LIEKRTAGARRLPVPLKAEIPWLDRNSAIPLHAQLRTAIEARIKSGEWADRLPPERRLCALFGVSRVTLRRTLRQLSSDGRVVAQHGRGHYVSSRAPRRRMLALAGFPRQEPADFGNPRPTILSAGPCRPSASAAGALGLSPGERVLAIRRLRSLSGRPAALETIVLPLSRFAGLAAEDFEDPLFGTLARRKYGLRPARALSQWQAVACPQAEAKLLEIGAASPVFRVRRTSFDVHGRALEHLDAFVRGDLYGFQAELREPDEREASERTNGPVVPFRKS
jgi:GntR family transcriptional regulator